MIFERSKYIRGHVKIGGQDYCKQNVLDRFESDQNIIRSISKVGDHQNVKACAKDSLRHDIVLEYQPRLHGVKMSLIAHDL